jgi:hypothetical protein
MKMKQRWKQWIAIILVIALSLTSVPALQVQAETDGVVQVTTEWLSDLLALEENKEQK